MDNRLENRQIIENIIKNFPGFRKNEDLLEEMITESLKKAGSFLENSTADAASDIYVKKIVGTVIVEILKNADKIRAEKNKKEEEANNFQEIPIKYETDENGKILYNIEIEIPDKSAYAEISPEKTEALKEKINKLDNENPAKKYKKIFERRFLEEKSYLEISEELEIPNKEILAILHELFKEINLVLTA